MASSKRVLSVRLERYEGPVEECGTKTFRGPDALTRASACLTQWAGTAPDGGAYDKCGVTIEGADGHGFCRRYDLHRGEVVSLATYFAVRGITVQS